MKTGLMHSTHAETAHPAIRVEEAQLQEEHGQQAVPLLEGGQRPRGLGQLQEHRGCPAQLPGCPHGLHLQAAAL